jgi:hypothetical protein
MFFFSFIYFCHGSLKSWATLRATTSPVYKIFLMLPNEKEDQRIDLHIGDDARMERERKSCPQ